MYIVANRKLYLLWLYWGHILCIYDPQPALGQGGLNPLRSGDPCPAVTNNGLMMMIQIIYAFTLN